MRFLNKIVYLCGKFLKKDTRKKEVKKAGFFKQFYTGYYSLILGFLSDIFNIIKENSQRKNVEKIKEKTHQKRERY